MLAFCHYLLQSVTNYHLYLHEKATNREQAQYIFLAIYPVSVLFRVNRDLLIRVTLSQFLIYYRN